MSKFLLRLLIVGFLGLIHPISQAKTLIITHNFNAPAFIELQHKTFKKFVQNDYEYVVFNDANNEPMAHQIASECEKYEVKCIRVPQEIHTRPYLPRQPKDPLQRTNIRHANCVQYSFDTLGFDHDGIVMVIDSDMMLIRPLNFEQYMSDKNIAAFMKGASDKVTHLCPALCIFKMNELPNPHSMNFNCGMVDGANADSGGFTYYYLQKYRNEINLVAASYLPSHALWLGNHDIRQSVDHSIADHVKTTKYQELGFNEKEIEFLLKKPDTFEFLLDLHFLHYHGASNYSRQSQAYHARKLQIFREFVESITA
jgi:hypothetical protein